MTMGWLQIELHQGVVAYAVEAGWHLRSDLHFRSLPPEIAGDGILCDFLMPEHKGLLDRHGNKPVTGIFMAHPKIKVPRVVPDDYANGRLAATHFLARGFRHFLVLMPGNNWATQQRVLGFEETLHKAGLSCEVHTMAEEITGNIFSHTVQEDWLIGHLQNTPKPVGVFCSYSTMQVDPTQSTLDAGFSIPEEVAFVSINNETHAGNCTAIPLTTVDVDWFQVGWQAALLLHRQIQGESVPPETIIIPPKGVTPRKTSDTLAVDDLRVARAITVIRERYGKAIDTEYIVHRVGIPRRTLESLFRKHLNRGIGEELLRYRIEIACGLLRTTTQTAAAIGEQVGFHQPSYFYRQFRLKTGTTAKAYRKQNQDPDPADS